MLWVDKHQPKELDERDPVCNLIASGEFPHLLVYGPDGAGKQTRIKAILRKLFGPEVDKVQLVRRFIRHNNTSIEIDTFTSKHHIEITPSDVGSHDRIIVQHIIKTLAQDATLYSKLAQESQFRVVLINRADQLSRDAQHALRRTMEVYMRRCRIILCCESATRITAPLRSRCFPLRVAAPTLDQIVQVLASIAVKENKAVNQDTYQKIAMLSGRNLRRAILMLEASCVEPERKLQPAEWELFVDNVAQHVSPQQLPTDQVYELLTNHVPPHVVLKSLALALLKRTQQQWPVVIRLAAKYEHRIHDGTRPVLHIQTFLAKCMVVFLRNKAVN